MDCGPLWESSESCNPLLQMHNTDNSTATLRGSESLPKYITCWLMTCTFRACDPATGFFLALNNNHRGTCHSQWSLQVINHLILTLRAPESCLCPGLLLCRLSALRRDVWSCLAETTVTAWSRMWTGISAATIPSISCSWSMKVLKRRKTREHHVTRVYFSGEAFTAHFLGSGSLQLGGELSVADSLSPGVKPYWPLCLLQSVRG